MAESFIASVLSVNEGLSLSDPFQKYILTFTQNPQTLNESWKDIPIDVHMIWFKISYISGLIDWLTNVQMDLSLYDSSSWNSWMSLAFNSNYLDSTGLLSEGLIVSMHNFDPNYSAFKTDYYFISGIRSSFYKTNISYVRAAISGNSWNYSSGIQIAIDLYKVF